MRVGRRLPVSRARPKAQSPQKAQIVPRFSARPPVGFNIRYPDATPVIYVNCTEKKGESGSKLWWYEMHFFKKGDGQSARVCFALTRALAELANEKLAAFKLGEGRKFIEAGRLEIVRPFEATGTNAMQFEFLPRGPSHSLYEVNQAVNGLLASLFDTRPEAGLLRKRIVPLAKGMVDNLSGCQPGFVDMIKRSLSPEKAYQFLDSI